MYVHFASLKGCVYGCVFTCEMQMSGISEIGVPIGRGHFKQNRMGMLTLLSILCDLSTKLP